MYKSPVILARVRYKQSCPTVNLCTSIWACPRAEKIKASLGRIRATKGSLISESFSLWLRSPKKVPNGAPHTGFIGSKFERVYFFGNLEGGTITTY